MTTGVKPTSNEEVIYGKKLVYTLAFLERESNLAEPLSQKFHNWAMGFWLLALGIGKVASYPRRRVSSSYLCWTPAYAGVTMREGFTIGDWALGIGDLEEAVIPTKPKATRDLG